MAVIEKEPKEGEKDPTKGAATIPTAEKDPKGTASKKVARYTIYIAEGREEETRDVFVGVNGVHYLLKRGVEVPNVPEGVINVLRESVQTFTDKDVDTGEERIRNIPRFSVNIIEGPYFEFKKPIA